MTVPPSHMLLGLCCLAACTTSGTSSNEDTAGFSDNTSSSESDDETSSLNVDDTDVDDTDVDDTDAVEPPPAVVINELMPANRGSVPGPDGLALDWIELVNLSPNPVDLTGWGLTDDWREPHAAPLPDGLMIGAGERVLLWLDPGGGTDGALALGLAREGEAIRLFDARGEEASLLGYPELRVDQVWARIPDGTGEGEAMPRGTPGEVNARVIETTASIVREGEDWRYLDGGQVPEGGMAGPWTHLDFDDSDWLIGAAPLGYGDAQVTQIDDGATEEGRATTAFFRRELTVDIEAGSLQSITLGLRADDGARVWLDGEELVRLGLPTGEVTADTAASRTTSGDTELIYSEESIDPGLLTPGTHILAVDLHQANRSSSDMTFDLWLEAEVLAVVE